MRNGLLLQSDGKLCPSKRETVARGWIRFAAILGVMAWGAVGLAAGQAGGQPGQAKAAPSAEMGASESCATCHEDVVKAFAENPHAKNLGSGQRDANASCLSCHSGHGGKNDQHLLRAAQPGLCFECHADVKPDFSMPFHHKVEEGLMACTDCHDPHGSSGRGGLKSAAAQDAVCTRCHKEKAGPFVYEHDAVKTEGCTACHFAHGGANPGLLNRASVNTICLQCHSPSTNSGTHHQAGKDQACTTCHADIHGSNVHSDFLKSSL